MLGHKRETMSHEDFYGFYFLFYWNDLIMDLEGHYFSVVVFFLDVS